MLLLDFSTKLQNVRKDFTLKPYLPLAETKHGIFKLKRNTISEECLQLGNVNTFLQSWLPHATCKSHNEMSLKTDLHSRFLLGVQHVTYEKIFFQGNRNFAEVKAEAGSYLKSLFKDTPVLNPVFQKCLLENQSKYLILQVWENGVFFFIPVSTCSYSALCFMGPSSATKTNEGASI